MLEVLVVIAAILSRATASSESFNASLAKVSGGVAVSRSQAPDFALLSVTFRNVQTQACGGTLLFPLWVLTSATCLFE